MNHRYWAYSSKGLNVFDPNPRVAWLEYRAVNSMSMGCVLRPWLWWVSGVAVGIWYYVRTGGSQSLMVGIGRVDLSYGGSPSPWHQHLRALGSPGALDQAIPYHLGPSSLCSWVYTYITAVLIISWAMYIFLFMYHFNVIILLFHVQFRGGRGISIWSVCNQIVDSCILLLQSSI